jgi:predicted anti-sigma-YlaC factor YlaD
MSDCDDLFEGLKDYLDGTAKEEICKALEAHMEECPNCKIHVNTLKGTIEIYQALGGKKMPEDARQRLHKALKIKPEWLKEP